MKAHKNNVTNSLVGLKGESIKYLGVFRILAAI